jgi:predicted double-glycine peptidase
MTDWRKPLARVLAVTLVAAVGLAVPSGALLAKEEVQDTQQKDQAPKKKKMTAKEKAEEKARKIRQAKIKKKNDQNKAASPFQPVKSLYGLRTTNVVMQQYDFSCGAAALATLINGYFGTKYTELDILKVASKRYPLPAWKARVKAGLSLDDLAFAATELGFSAQGAKIGIAGLRQIEGPIIVHEAKQKNLQHFAVLRGIKDGQFVLADPSVGNVTYSAGEFAQEFTGYALAVWKEGSKLPGKYPLEITATDGRSDLYAARAVSGRVYEWKQTPY